jgi:hypothetical protein
VLAHFLHLVDDNTFRLVLLTLHPALCFFPLFLLPRLLFLAFIKSGSSSWHSQFLLSFFASGAGPQLYASGCFQETRKLPARFARLACVPLIIIAPASPSSTAATKPLSTATATPLGTVGLGLRLVDFQRASAQFRPVQRRDSLVGLGGIGHFHESKAAGTAGFAIGHNADFFHRTMSLEYGSQFGLGSAVGQITYVKILHSSSSLSETSKGRDSAAFIFSLESGAESAPKLRYV